MNDPGQSLLTLLRGARSEATIIAPFMKVGALEKIAQCLEPSIRLSCVTRWFPHEIKAGVSDLEVWDALKAFDNAQLFLVQRLHAKFYRADDRYLVGSANITHAALGWSSRPNIELLVPGQVDSEWMSWESSLIAQGALVDEALVYSMRSLVEDLPPVEFIIADGDLDSEFDFDIDQDSAFCQAAFWLPVTRYPLHLFSGYRRDLENLTAAARETVAMDLFALSIPRGLDEYAFHAAVAGILLQMPLVRRVDEFLVLPRRFGEVRNFLSSLEEYPSFRDPTGDWQTLMRWLKFFLEERYEFTVPNYTEVVRRII